MTLPGVPIRYDQDISFADDVDQQITVTAVLEVEYQGLLAVIEPHEIGTLAVNHRVISACKIPFPALHLDHPRASGGQF